MCTGPFKLDAWKPGDVADRRAQRRLLGQRAQAQAQSMVFKGVPDDSSLTTGLLTNEITAATPSR